MGVEPAGRRRPACPTAAPTKMLDVGSALAAPEQLTQAQAARLAGVSVCQVIKWQTGGVLTPSGAVPYGSKTRRLFNDADVLAAKRWRDDRMWEEEATRELRVETGTLTELVAAGRLPEPVMYRRRRVYSREAVLRERTRRSRLLSQREVSRQYDLPYWVLRRLVDDGVLPVEGGAKGSYLIDPYDLKPLLECKPCPVCDAPLLPGRRVHPQCEPRTEEGRRRASAHFSAYYADAATRAEHGRRMMEWWASDAAAPFRSRLAAMPCAECEKQIVRRASKTRDREQVFCSKACVARWRWRTGIGLERLIEEMPGVVRRKYKGRWNGHKGKDHGIKGKAYGVQGKEHGIESRFSNVGRPAKSTLEQKQLVLTLDKQGLSQRDIAERVFGDRKLHLRVHRILNG